MQFVIDESRHLWSYSSHLLSAVQGFSRLIVPKFDRVHQIGDVVHVQFLQGY